MVENCVGTVGFSVGEYASLVFAGAIEFEDGNYFNIIKMLFLFYFLSFLCNVFIQTM